MPPSISVISPPAMTVLMNGMTRRFRAIEPIGNIPKPERCTGSAARETDSPFIRCDSYEGTRSAMPRTAPKENRKPDCCRNRGSSISKRTPAMLTAVRRS